MNYKIKTFFLSNNQNNFKSQNIGFLLLRLVVGLALCTIFEKLFPKNGIWGPQQWFIEDTARMGFPLPTFFAWLAVLVEFIGGILMMLGLFTRPAALLNAFVTFTATFIYHKGDITGSGLLSFIFLVMCICILLFGAGKFSLEYLVYKRHVKKITTLSTFTFLLLPADNAMATNKTFSFNTAKSIDDIRVV
jgi:putative oxidoreductase